MLWGHFIFNEIVFLYMFYPENYVLKYEEFLKKFMNTIIILNINNNKLRLIKYCKFD